MGERQMDNLGVIVYLLISSSSSSSFLRILLIYLIDTSVLMKSFYLLIGFGRIPFLFLSFFSIFL